MPDAPKELDFDPADLVVVDGETITRREAAIRAGAGTLGDVETAQQQAAEAKEKAAEERLGTLGRIQTGVEGAAEGITFGLTRALTDQDELAALEAEERRQTFAGTFVGGEVVGAILPSLLTGGSTTATSLARLTPAGLTAAKGAAFVARGTTRLGKAVRLALSGGAEGATQAAVTYLARETVRGEPISAEAVASQAMRGGSFGALAGGILGIGGAAAGRLRSALTEAPPSTRALDELAPAKSLDEPGPIGSVKVDDLVGSRPEAVDEAFGRLTRTLDDARVRSRSTEMDDLFLDPRITSRADEAQLGRLREAGSRAQREYLEAAEVAANWSGRLSKSIDAAPGADLATKVQAASDDLIDEGAYALARLDEARVAYDDVIDRVRSQYLVEPELAAAPATLAGRAGTAFKAARETAEKVGAAAETAQDLGLDVPSPSQLLGGGAIGEALGWYLKLKAGAAAARKVGVLPRALGAGAAQAATAARSSIQDTVRTAAQGAARGAVKALTAAAPTLSPAAVRGMASAARDLTGDQEAQAASAEAGFAGLDVAQAAGAGASHAARYLANKAPVNPFEGTPFSDTWTPNVHETQDFVRRTRSVLDPTGALARVATDPAAVIEAEAVSQAYPQMWAAFVQEVGANAASFARGPDALVQSLGRTTGIVLSPTQIAGYGRFGEPAQQQPPPSRLGNTTVAGTSAIAETESPEEPGL